MLIFISLWTKPKKNCILPILLLCFYVSMSFVCPMSGIHLVFLSVFCPIQTCAQISLCVYIYCKRAKKTYFLLYIYSGVCPFTCILSFMLLRKYVVYFAHILDI